LRQLRYVSQAAFIMIAVDIGRAIPVLGVRMTLGF
jgi:hypothetical protein